ncbi:hypothetical protein J3Q64DRAFT_1760575 [Phycomyces blakesleeanus]|uniref:Uncharacterized protein n=2 Tax=Phycomyces blakesleeanus TaxID=4837 RepID=A0A167KTQ9_PHYB8|nr:hypothetical protein PHYBLDRAFT_182980 [Phycomyces blakesleeanus NRRL 1555(-)]OAD68858.1 hypothetical protein PHYBLDRAFT_182980 [Phycomyces blakesleeanus NRRL 1555(-)]|eukprot:XP_018286898.1 hypothetical protein PHYBLDRAFT_182980 [Phycomyces blakesleeanus NRRL 1555(-)]
MFNKRTATWFGIGILGLAIHHLSPVIPLLGVGVSVPSIGSEGCVHITGPSDYQFCEDSARSTTEKGVTYSACDPIRDIMNPVMDFEVLHDLSEAKTGAIWRINYTSENPQPEKLTVRGSPPVSLDFHPLGLAIDFNQENQKSLILTANLPILGGLAGVEIFGLEENAEDGSKELVYIRSINNPLLNAPNNIHIIHDPRFRGSDGVPSFYISNDHYYTHDLMKVLENYLLLPVSTVFFYDARTDTLKPVIKDLIFANGVTGDETSLFVAETNRMVVRQYEIRIKEDKDNEGSAPTISLQYVTKKSFPMAVDNLSYDSSIKEVIVAGHPKGLQFLQYTFSENKENMTVPPSLVMSWDVQSGNVKKLFSDDGTVYGTSTTALRDSESETLFISGLLNRGVLVCPLKE